MAKRNLGRGLGALISENSTETDEKLINIDIDRVKPNKNQPRKQFDQDKMSELMDSIDQYGIIQPIVVRSIVDGYEIIAGERRWRAAKNLKINQVPVVVRKADDITVAKLAIIENIQREDLNEIEEANAYQQLIDEHGLTQQKLSEIIGKSRPYIANLLRLLNLEPEIQDELVNGEISNGHARALLSLDTAEQRVELLNKVIRNNYSVRKTEKIIKKMKSAPKSSKNKPSKQKTNEVIAFENELSDKFGTKVQINHNASYKGKIEIEYYSLDDLNRILEKL